MAYRPPKGVRPPQLEGKRTGRPKASKNRPDMKEVLPLVLYVVDGGPEDDMVVDFTREEWYRMLINALLAELPFGDWFKQRCDGLRPPRKKTIRYEELLASCLCDRHRRMIKPPMSRCLLCSDAGKARSEHFQRVGEQ